MTPKPYHPANGTEGAMFIDALCSRCRRDVNQECPILADSFLGQVPEWVEDENGETCTAFDSLDEPVDPAQTSIEFRDNP